MIGLGRRDANRFAELLLTALHREYPNKISHVLASDDDVLPPRQLTPAFFGCFDWHSSVHSHWALARLLYVMPDASFAAAARSALDRSFTTSNIDGELAYLNGAGRQHFELPYGLAWLLLLVAELDAWDDEQAGTWRRLLAPLEAIAAERLNAWLGRLTFPVRSGEHTQTAFAVGLMLDWARATRQDTVRARIAERATTLYGADKNAALHLEPSGNDFLSPCLAEADLMRRVLEPGAFGAWLTGFLPTFAAPGDGIWPRPVTCPDPSDAKLAHLDGLNLSRAWMLQGIARGLPEGDARRPRLKELAAIHGRTGLEAVTGDHYTRAHWLGSFATYYTTYRGLGTAEES